VNKTITPIIASGSTTNISNKTIVTSLCINQCHQPQRETETGLITFLHRCKQYAVCYHHQRKHKKDKQIKHCILLVHLSISTAAKATNVPLLSQSNDLRTKSNRLQARAEYEAGLKFRHDREKDWKKAEDQYFNRQAKSLKQRYNVPVPIIPGFIDAWKAKINKTEIQIDPGDDADYKATLKVNAHYLQQQNFGDDDWETIEDDGKFQVGLYGRAFNKYFAQSKPSYQSNLEFVDVYDFIGSPLGGGSLEKHRFLGQDNLFKTKEDLKYGVEAMDYDRQAVEALINATSQDTIVDNDNIYKSKQNRFVALGQDGFTHNYAGQSLYKFIEWGTTWKNQRYYVLFNYELGIGVKVVPLKEVFKSNLWWFTSWASHRDPSNLWSKAPVDDVLPLAEIIRVLVNQELDNRLKRNFGQRAYDPDVFPNPAELEFRPDGLVAVKAGTSKVQEISKGVYQFETPELQGTINTVQWIDNMLKEKSGVNSESQGQSDQDKVGIAYLNLQQSSERSKDVNKSFNKNKKAIVRRYIWGLHEHMRNPISVRIIGEKGAYWEELARREINPDWNIVVKDGSAALEADEVKKKSLKEVFATLAEDELAVTSPRWRAETKFRILGIDEDEIRMAFDKENEGNREILSEASQMIQVCLEDKPYKINRGANTAFCQKIMDYAYDTEDLPEDKFTKLMQIVEAHIPIAQENAARKAVQMAAQQGIPPDQLASPQMNPSEMLLQSQNAAQIAPNTPGGTMSRSQELTPQIAPNA
jgi:hypothetical protein